MGKILVKNGRVWNGWEFLESDILTQDDRIVKIEKEIEDPADYIFDATGKIVSAGLVDAHVHMKGISCDAYGIQAEMSCLPFGVTAAADAGAGYGDREKLDFMGIRNCVFVQVKIRENKADFTKALEMLKKYGDKAIGVKICFDKSTGEVWNMAPLQEVVAFAEEHGLIVMVHSSHSPVPMPEVLRTLRKGDILTHAYHGGTHTVLADHCECIKEAKKRGVVIDAGLAGHIHTDFQVFREAIAAEAIPDVISTDITKYSAYKRGGRYGLPMCMSIAGYLGMSEEDIFRAVTSAPAKALGKEKEWGTLAVGRKADIAVLEYTQEPFDLTDKAGNHIFSEQGYRNVFTIADGEVVYRR